MIKLSKNQWAMMFYADKNRLIEFGKYKQRSITALENKNLIYQSDLGYKLTDEGLSQVNIKKLSDAKRNALENEFFYLWERYGNKSTIYRDVEGEGREHVFIIPNNKARFDFVFPKYKLAVEVQGGTWVRGGHSRGKGQTRDSIKNNLAAAAGWQTLTFTSDMLNKDGKGCIDHVLDAMTARARYALWALGHEADSINANPVFIAFYDIYGNEYLTIEAAYPHFRAMLVYILNNFLWDKEEGDYHFYTPNFTGSENLLIKQQRQYEARYGEIK